MVGLGGGQIGWVVVNSGSVGEGRRLIPLILLKTWWVLLVVLAEPPCSALSAFCLAPIPSRDTAWPTSKTVYKPLTAYPRPVSALSSHYIY